MNIVNLSHGSGGKQTDELIKEIFVKNFSNPYLNKLEDSAVIEINNLKIAYTTDSYVVDPIFFSGGDIGRLSVCGTVNDIAVSGARPLYLSCGFIIEEGFEIEKLKKIVSSAKKTALEAGVKIVCGDTKVVEKGKADKIFINTSGIGIFDKELNFSYKNVRKGDIIILSGEIGMHGICILNERNNLGLKGSIKSDVAPLNGLIETIREIEGIRCMKDLTRGGLITALNEISQSCGFGAEIYEDKVPVSKPVISCCDILGIDPMYVANEGKIIVIVEERSADKVLETMRRHKYGKKATVIGKFNDKNYVSVITKLGSRRIAPSLSGDQLPRIC
jgi:hydrogenase expression/formation protein HypE